jgi:pyruvate dehydrogenase E1 component alpha subunit
LATAPASSAPHAPLAREQLLRAYRTMKTIREFEERLHVEIQTGEIPGFTHLYAGQEAVAVGVCEHLSDRDYIVSTHRGHGHCLAKGCDVQGMMYEIYGRAAGLCKGKGGSMHIADVTKGMLGANAIVGGGPPLAVGAAIACRNRKDGTVSVAFGGDGSANQGTVFEAMNMAVVLKVPALFVFENNGYSEHTGADYAVGSKDIAGRARGFGMPAEKCDGSDFFAVYEAFGRLCAHARAGGGPATLEPVITRYYGHFEGDPQLYRAKDEVKRLRETMDCLKKFRARVEGEGWLKASDLDPIDEQVLAQIDVAVKSARSAPPAPESEVTTDVYATY